MKGNRMNLAKQAKAFLDTKTRVNPAGVDTDAMFNEFIVSLKEAGQKTSEWTEGEWFEAARQFGYEEMDLGTMMEVVASWGVDE